MRISLDDNDNIYEEKALKNKDFRDVFGSEEKRGKVQFLDAYPDEVNFATDIMNPHYPYYYSGSEPPTDHQNPKPIPFLTVENTTFRFAFLAKHQSQNLLDEIENRFQEALELKGVGAKTAVGYGYFGDIKNKTDTITDEIKREQEEAERQQEVERIKSLSPIEKLAEEVKRLTDSQVDEQRATQIYNEQLPSLEGDDEKLIAEALKAYWQHINKWEGGSDKQRQKVMKVKSILGER